MIRQSGPPVVTQPSILTIFRCLPMLFISVISERKLRRSSRLAFADKKNKLNKKMLWNEGLLQCHIDAWLRTSLSMRRPTAHDREEVRFSSLTFQFFDCYDNFL